MSDPIRIGIIGGGAITQVGHLPVLKKLKGVAVHAICDSDVPKVQAIAQRYRIPNAVDDIDDLLRIDGLDAVVICTPNHLHESHVQAAVSAGLHVLVEKPVVTVTGDVMRVKRAAEKRNVHVMVGMSHRYRTDVQIVRSFVQSGELGAIESVRGSWHVFRPSRSMLGWRLRREQ